MESGRTRFLSNPWGWLLLALVLLRALSLAAAPLADFTEARYAEIARLMLSLGDWISPHITPSEVFWAKPPLSTWGQALAMDVFGVSAWAARLPALGWSVLSMLALAWMLRSSFSAAQRGAALVLLALCPLFFICAGAVMTDATLGATVMLVQAAWWQVLQGQEQGQVVIRRRAARLLALGMGLALLTKGPAAAVLALLPILLHTIWQRKWAVIGVVLRDPWVWLLGLGISLPWYIWAEIKTPGFLQYFVLGEHVMRFLQSGWKGDRYGYAHAEPFGIVWLYAVVAGLPAVLMVLTRLPWLRLRHGAGAVRQQLGATGTLDLARYALCMALAPLLLFSFASNIIFTYALTALPGLVIVAICLCPARIFASVWAWLSAGLLVLVYAWGLFCIVPDVARQHSDAPLIAAYNAACPSQQCRLHYAATIPYSAHFYSQGRLYAGMVGTSDSAGTPVAQQASFTVQPRSAVASPDKEALVCNEERCLLRDKSVDKPVNTPPVP